MTSKLELKVGMKVRLASWKPHEFLEILSIGKNRLFYQGNDGYEGIWEIHEDWQLYEEPAKAEPTIPGCSCVNANRVQTKKPSEAIQIAAMKIYEKERALRHPSANIYAPEPEHFQCRRLFMAMGETLDTLWEQGYLGGKK